MNEQTLTLVAIALFAASEIVGLNPRLRENSVLQLVLRLGKAALRSSLPSGSQFRDR